MAQDITPVDFWRTRSLPALWEDIEDMFPTLPTYGVISGLSISEDDSSVYVDASVPGIQPEDIDITFEKGVLWIKGEAKEEKKDRKYYKKASSSFSYRVALPSDIDINSEPQATCENGVMKITFQKSPKAKPKKIAVKPSNGKK